MPGNTTDPIVFIQKTDFFKLLPYGTIKKLSAQFEAININSGETLIEEGDQGDSLYLVMHGRLRVFKRKNHDNVVVGELGPGDMIGELALLSEEPRAATVIAIRDSKLLKLSKMSFDKFVNENPLQILPMVKSAISRLLQPPQPHRTNVTTIAIAPAGDTDSHEKFSQKITHGIEHHTATFCVNRESVLQFLKQQNLSADAIEDDKNEMISRWLLELEKQYRYVIYETDKQNTPWTKRCLRQADRILLVADSLAHDFLNPIEESIFSQSSKTRKIVNIIFLQNEQVIQPANTSQWLKRRTVAGHYHVREESLEDMRRLIHVIRGRSIGLILGGGGARSLAHIGVYKALCDLKLPVDLVGGTSFGAVVGALIANNMSVNDIIDVLNTKVAKNKKLFDYTFPMVSIVGAKWWSVLMRDVMGDLQIEDLWKRFFCVACNITKNRPEIFQSGPLWHALRAAISLPGVAPPITNAEGDLLVDGGVVNNLPVDIMQDIINGGTTIAVQVAPISVLKASIPEGYVSGWKLLWEKYFKSGQGEPIPGISEIIWKSITLAGDNHETLMVSLADYCLYINVEEFKLLDFSAMSSLVDRGYQTAMEKLPDFIKKTSMI